MLIGPATHPFTLQDAYGATLADYLFYPNDELVYVRWHGHLTAAEVIRGVSQGSLWAADFDYSLILNDKSDTGGDWSDALPWLHYEWLPQALEKGIRAMAYVFSPDRTNRFVTQEFVGAISPQMAIELFDDRDLAIEWLLRQKGNAVPVNVLGPAGR